MQWCEKIKSINRSCAVFTSQLQTNRWRMLINMNPESQEKLACDVCEKKFRTVGALTKHMNKKNAHDGMRRNAKNKVVFACNVCDKAYSSQRNLRRHRYYSKHALMNSTTEHTVNKIEPMEEPAENIYSSNGRIRNEISHEKERVIELSTSLALGNVQEVVKRAFRSIREEMIPLYVTANVERMDALDRILNAMAPFENGLLMTLMHDTFNVADELKSDLESL